MGAWGQIFFSTGGNGGGTDTNTNLGNSNLTADGSVRTYNVDGKILRFINGTAFLAELSSNGLKLGITGSQYTMPAAKSGTNGHVLQAAGTGGDTPVWQKLIQDVLLNFAGSLSGGLNARELLAFNIGGSTIINLGSSASPNINMLTGKDLFVVNTGAWFSGTISFDFVATFEGSISAGAGLKPFIGVSTQSAGSNSQTFTITYGSVINLQSPIAGRANYFYGTITYTASGNQLLIFGFSNASSLAALNTGNINVSGTIRLQKSL